MYDTFVPARAMVIVAHPDDAEFSCSGTIARWVEAGCEVCYVLCTSGDVGIAEEDMTRARAIAIREAEQRAAVAAVGVTEVVFLREPDGMLEATMLLRKRLVREIRRFLRPEVVLAGDPYLGVHTQRPDQRPDSPRRRPGGRRRDLPLSSGASRTSSRSSPASAWPHKIRKLYVFGFGDGNVYSDITATIDRKIAALQAHPSQRPARGRTSAIASASGPAARPRRPRKTTPTTRRSKRWTTPSRSASSRSRATRTGRSSWTSTPRRTRRRRRTERWSGRFRRGERPRRGRVRQRNQLGIAHPESLGPAVPPRSTLRSA
ncbi:MAG: PIG-L family deacetylase [Anaerolineae bacterium]